VYRLPRQLRLAAAGVVMLLVGGAVCFSSFSRSARLNIVCQHSFSAAEVSVFVDGDLVYRGQAGGTKKRFGFFGSSKPRELAKSIGVPSGRHTVQVRLNAQADGFDQTRSASLIFSPNQEHSLSITQDRRGLFLTSQAASELPVESGSLNSYQKYLGSIVLSILGSGMSAVIGFLVQDFMRTQKGKLAAAVTSQIENGN
jgi:hypothetical protein